MPFSAGPRPPGDPGPTGEVAMTDLENAILGTAMNPETVAELILVVSDPPTQAEVQQIADKLNELISTLKRV